MLKPIRSLLLASLLVSATHNIANAQENYAPQVTTYEQIVFTNYSDALAAAKNLQAAINAFLATPDQAHLKVARDSWIIARVPYLQTEVFRFYEGPIDFADPKSGKSGPEAQINAWPLNEAYIDYVAGNPKSGIVNDPAAAITMDTLKAKNQQKDEADVATGYHAIEFLLWGQDSNAKGPGARPATDFTTGDPVKERRRAYLAATTQLLVDDLTWLTQEWAPNQNNFARHFSSLDPKEALGRILTGAASLSSAEIASERMNNALLSGDQEDEQSCFSDTTHQDFVNNARGIKNVYLGEYGGIKGASISALVAAKDPALDQRVRAQLDATESLIAAIPTPFDQVLATAVGSPERQKVQAVISSLQTQAELIKKAGETLGVKVAIVSP